MSDSESETRISETEWKPKVKSQKKNEKPRNQYDEEYDGASSSRRFYSGNPAPALPHTYSVLYDQPVECRPPKPDEIMQMACVEGKTRERAIKKIIKLTTAPKKTAHSYAWFSLRQLVRSRIEMISALLETNDPTLDEIFSPSRRYGALFVALIMLRHADLDSSLKLQEEDVTFAEFVSSKILTFFHDRDANVQQLTYEYFVLAGIAIGDTFYESKIEILFNATITLLSNDETEDATDNGNMSRSASDMHSCNPEYIILARVVQCLLEVSQRLGKKFIPLLNDRKVEVFYCLLKHPSPVVRETACHICTEIISTEMLREQSWGLKLTSCVVECLSDSVSLVRLASAKAVRSLLRVLKLEDRDAYFAVVMPPLCLSRYYMADAKFMLITQSTWRESMKGDGIHYVTRYLNHVVDHYILALKSSNTHYADAACSCLAELTSKISKDEITPYMPGILKALDATMTEGEWDVSDSATVAFGACINQLPHVCRRTVDKLTPFLISKLSFPLSKVRKGASSTIASIIREYDGSVLPPFVNHVEQSLEGIHSQLPPFLEDVEYVDVERLVIISMYGATPKIDKPVEPWERADGCLYLIGDICDIKHCQSFVIEMIPTIIRVGQFRYYKKHVIVLDSLCKILPLVAKCVGKAVLKKYLEQFFEIIFYVIELNNSASPSGLSCLHELSKLIGPNILRARVESFDERYLKYCENLDGAPLL